MRPGVCQPMKNPPEPDIGTPVLRVQQERVGSVSTLLRNTGIRRRICLGIAFILFCSCSRTSRDVTSESPAAPPSSTSPSSQLGPGAFRVVQLQRATRDTWPAPATHHRRASSSCGSRRVARLSHFGFSSVRGVSGFYYSLTLAVHSRHEL